MPRKIVVASALVVALASSAVAETVVTSPPIWVDPSTQTLRCLFSNLDAKKSVVGHRYVVDGLGGNFFDSAVTLPPGETTSVPFAAAFGVLRCVLGGKLSRKKVAVTACALTGGRSDTCVSTGP